MKKQSAIPYPRNSPKPPSAIRKLAELNGRTFAGQKQGIYGPHGLVNRMDKLLSDLCGFNNAPMAHKILDKLTQTVRVRPPVLRDRAAKLQWVRVSVEALLATWEYEIDPSPQTLERAARTAERVGFLAMATADQLRAEQRKPVLL